MAMNPAKRRSIDDPVVAELQAIKRLLILQLLSSGVSATHIAMSLGVDNAVISRLVPARAIKKARSK